jgi:hypothetical protein
MIRAAEQTDRPVYFKFNGGWNPGGAIPEGRESFLNENAGRGRSRVRGEGLPGLSQTGMFAQSPHGVQTGHMDGFTAFL